VIGMGFYNCTEGIRTCDNQLVYPDDVVGIEIHAAGQVICGFNWDLRLLLEDKLGAAAGEMHTATLWHWSRKLYGWPEMTQPDQVEFYRWVDDDDGNLGNGTPNWEEICEAATNHGFSCGIDPNRIEIEHTPLANTTASGPFAIETIVRTFVAGEPTPADEVELYYALNGGAFTGVPMSAASDTLYVGEIPAQEAGTAVTYYLRASHSTGLEEFHPPGAPAFYHMFGVGEFEVVVDDDMEQTAGYTVGAPGDNATAGIWERGDPVLVQLGLMFQPDFDHTPDPGTDCWITGNSNLPPPFGDELDGRTSLNTPVLDFAGANLVEGSLWVWTYFMNPEADDYLDLNLTTDGGASWTTVVRVQTTTSPDWQQRTFRLSPHDFEFTDQMQFRLVADDPNSDALVETLVDDFLVEALFGSGTAIGGDQAAAPLRLALGRATPNPFNPSTAIPFSLPVRAEVRLVVYDVSGRFVRALVDGVREAGEYQARWDGRDARGASAATGVYYYALEVGDWRDTRAMVLLR
jgi:hypothetical protein